MKNLVPVVALAAVLACLAGSRAADSPVTGTGRPVIISSPSLLRAPRISYAPVQFIKIDFGGPTVEGNPLRLFTITGTRRCTP